MSEFEVSPELLTIYLEDARQHLDALDQCLLTLEREGLEADAISNVLGPLHTLKGNSGMMGFSAIKDFVHRLEDVFAHIQDGGVTLSPAAIDQLLTGADALRDSVEKAAANRQEMRDLLAEKAQLDRLVEQEPAAPVAPRTSPAAAVAPPAPPPTTSIAVA